MPKPPIPQPKRHSEDYLARLRRIEIRLPDNSAVFLSVQDEIGLQEDRLHQEAETAPSRYAFWATIEQQAKRDMEEAKRLYDEELAYASIDRRQKIKLKQAYVSEKEVSDWAERYETVELARKTLDERTYQHGIVKAMKDAMNHRCMTINALLRRSKDDE